jgi:hypothetical protein
MDLIAIVIYSRENRLANRADVYWDCHYRTIEEYVPNVIAGNRGFCNLNPWSGPSQLVPYKHQKRHARY